MNELLTLSPGSLVWTAGLHLDQRLLPPIPSLGGEGGIPHMSYERMCVSVYVGVCTTLVLISSRAAQIS
jgi:hypothetical protein